MSKPDDDGTRRLIRAARPPTQEPLVDPQSPFIRSEVLRLLRRPKFMALSTLAAAIHCDEDQARDVIDHIAKVGYSVVWEGHRVRVVKGIGSQDRESLVDGSPLVNGVRTFGLLSDTHLASHQQRLDVLEAAYDEFARRKLTHVYHAGNLVDGHADFNRFELYAHGATDQAHYMLDNYPERKGMTTYFITGCCHEGWWFRREGLDIGVYFEGVAHRAGRLDLVYLGYGEADVSLEGPGGTSSVMKVMHPGGGSAYALSYKPQKILEAMTGGEKPAVLLIGHFHKASYNLIRNVHTIQAGCCQDQTKFMRSNNLDAHVGFWVVGLQQDAQGAVRRCIPELFNYFDRTYHIAANWKPGKGRK